MNNREIRALNALYSRKMKNGLQVHMDGVERMMSKGGKTNLANIVLATVENNAKRSNSLLSDYFQKDKADEYWGQFKDLIVEYQKGNKAKVFDGNQYIEQTKATVKKILTEEKRLDLWG